MTDDSSYTHLLWSVVAAVRAELTDDLLSPAYRRLEGRRPTTGHCYVASEAIYYLMAGRNSSLRSYHINHEGASHWFLRHESGLVVDATADQFDSSVPYCDARRMAFLTATPSKRAWIVIRAVRENKDIIMRQAKALSVL